MARKQGAPVPISRVYLFQWSLIAMALVPRGNCHGHVGQVDPHKRPQVPGQTSWLLAPLTSNLLSKALSFIFCVLKFKATAHLTSYLDQRPTLVKSPITWTLAHSVTLTDHYSCQITTLQGYQSRRRQLGNNCSVQGTLTG